MKKMILGFTALLTLILTGCSTTHNFSLPQNFSFEEREVPLVKVRFSVVPTPELTETFATQIFDGVDHYLRNTRRFQILLDNSNFKEECDLHVIASYHEHKFYNNKIFSYGASIDIKQKKNDGGFADNSTWAMGRSKPVIVEAGLANSPTIDKTVHFHEALNKVTFRFAEKLKRTYPVTGKIKDFACYDENTANFLIPIGTNYGLESDEDYLVCFRTKAGFYHVIALAKCNPGAKESQLAVYAWNLEDPVVKNELLPRVQRNDKSLLTAGTLFAVARIKEPVRK